MEEDFEHSAAVFSPDGKEVYWCARKNWHNDLPGDKQLRLYFMRQVGGRWTRPAVAPFTRDIDLPIQGPAFSPDGSRMYLQYSRTGNPDDDSDIYVSVRSGDVWSQPEPVSPLINSPAWERLHSVGPDGSLYFTRGLLTPNEEVFAARWDGREFTVTEELGEDFNSTASEFAILLAPDESFMLTAQNRDPRDDELYVSYRNPDGSWSERIKTPYPTGGFLSLSPDGKYLFFLNDDIFWVSTSFIEELRPTQSP
jgi:Tol biopolymer transport system component